MEDMFAASETIGISESWSKLTSFIGVNTVSDQDPLCRNREGPVMTYTVEKGVLGGDANCPREEGILNRTQERNSDTVAIYRETGFYPPTVPSVVGSTCSTVSSPSRLQRLQPSVSSLMFVPLFGCSSAL